MVAPVMISSVQVFSCLVADGPLKVEFPLSTIIDRFDMQMITGFSGARGLRGPDPAERDDEDRAGFFTPLLMSFMSRYT